jgi:hypothetical protein
VTGRHIHRISLTGKSDESEIDMSIRDERVRRAPGPLLDQAPDAPGLLMTADPAVAGRRVVMISH